MKNIIFILIIFLSSVMASAESRLIGSVKHNGEALAGVVIKVKNTSRRTIAFGNTNVSGEFSIALKPEVTLPVSAVFSCVGYEETTVVVENISKRVNVEMKEAAFELKEVVVRVPPVRSSGDTITYDVASFRSKSDRSIEDVIKRLPGIEIDGRGQISYNGAAINKFYIEGMDLLQGRYALATKNITPDDVQSVNVYENHQPKQVLKDLEMSDRAALNLKLKKGSMLRPIGTITGGAGYGDHALWVGEAFVMLISPKNQAIVTGKGNNAGKTYSNEVVNLLGTGPTGGTAAYGVFPQLLYSEPLIESSRYYNNTSAMGSVNDLQKTGSHSTLNINADYQYETNAFDNEVVTTYFGSGTNQIVTNEYAKTRLSRHVGNMRLKYELNSPQKFISNQLHLRGRFADNSYGVYQRFDIGQTINSNDFYVGNTFNTIVKTGKRSISVLSNVSVSNTPQNRMRAIVESRDSIAADQSVKGLNIHTLERSGINWAVGSITSIGVDLSFEGDYDTFHSNLYTDNEQFSGNPRNDKRGYNLCLTASPYLQLRKGSVVWRTTVPVKYSNMHYLDLISDETNGYSKVYPAFESKLDLRVTGSMRVGFSISKVRTLGGLSDFLVNPMQVSYRNQSTMGNGALNIRDTYSASATVAYRNTVEGLFWNLKLMYGRNLNSRMSSVDVDESQTVVKSIEQKNHTNTYNAMATASKLVRQWNTTFSLSTGAMLMGRNILRKNVEYGINTAIYSIEASSKSTFLNDKLAVNLSGAYNISHQSYKAGIMPSSTLSNIKAVLSLSVMPWRRWELHTGAGYDNISIDPSNRKSSVFVDAGARYSVRRISVDLTMRNLTNRKTYSFSTFVNGDTYNYLYHLRPLEIMLSLSWKL